MIIGNVKLLLKSRETCSFFHSIWGLMRYAWIFLAYLFYSLSKMYVAIKYQVFALCKVPDCPAISPPPQKKILFAESAV